MKVWFCFSAFWMHIVNKLSLDVSCCKLLIMLIKFSYTSSFETDFVYVTTLGADHYADVVMIEMASQITSLTIVYSTVYSDADQRKHQSSASLAFVRGIHRGPVNSPHKWPVTRKMFPFDDVIMQCNIRCLSQTHIKSCENLFIHNSYFGCGFVLQFCTITQHSSDTAMLCAKFQNDLRTVK